MGPKGGQKVCGPPMTDLTWPGCDSNCARETHSVHVLRYSGAFAPVDLYDLPHSELAIYRTITRRLEGLRVGVNGGKGTGRNVSISVRV